MEGSESTVLLILYLGEESASLRANVQNSYIVERCSKDLTFINAVAVHVSPNNFSALLIPIINRARKIHSGKTTRYGRDRQTTTKPPLQSSQPSVYSQSLYSEQIAHGIPLQRSPQQRKHIFADKMSGTIVAYPTLVSTFSLMHSITRNPCPEGVINVTMSIEEQTLAQR